MVNDKIKKIQDKLNAIERRKTTMTEKKPEEEEKPAEGLQRQSETKKNSEKELKPIWLKLALALSVIAVIVGLTLWTRMISLIVVIVVIIIVTYLLKSILGFMLGRSKNAVVEDKSEEALGPEKRGPSRILWDLGKFAYPVLLIAFIVLVIVFVVMLLVLLFSQRDFAIAIIAAIGISLIVGAIEIEIITKYMKVKVIPSDPASVGAERLFGRFTKRIYPPGYFLTISYKSFSIIDVVIIDIRIADQDFVVQDVATKDNAFVEVSGHASYGPDLTRILEFMRSGKYFINEDGSLDTDKGIPTILDNIFLQYQRTAIKRFDLEDALGASEKLSGEIEYHLISQTDTRKLGIKIFTANVTDILPSGETKKDLELAAQETFQRKGEIIEVVTRVRQSVAKILAARGIDITKMVDKNGKEDVERIKAEIEKIRKKEPKKFDAVIDEWTTAFIEYGIAKKTPGAVIPGMRERLKRKDGSVPFDVIGAGLANLFRRPVEAEPIKRSEETKPKRESDGEKNKDKKSKEER